MNKRNQNILTLTILVTVFTGYNCVIYLQGNASSSAKMSNKAIQGEQIFQDNNCISCHQIYGLGGYLGPDLTNIASHPNKRKNYITSMLGGGFGAMPRFQFTEQEKQNLYEFLRHIDQTGYYPNNEIEFNSIGWGKLKYK